MTGLADIPREILLDFISAVRVVGHPREHFDHRAVCRAVVSSLDHPSREDSVESEEGQIENDEEDYEILNEENTQEDVADEDNETYVDSSTRSSSLERKRTLQLEKAKLMSSSMPPSKSLRFNILYEASFYRSKMSKFLRLIILLPTNVSLSIARGFHNALKLYYDSIVNDIP